MLEAGAIRENATRCRGVTIHLTTKPPLKHCSKPRERATLAARRALRVTTGVNASFGRSSRKSSRAPSATAMSGWRSWRPDSCADHRAQTEYPAYAAYIVAAGHKQKLPVTHNVANTVRRDPTCLSPGRRGT